MRLDPSKWAMLTRIPGEIQVIITADGVMRGGKPIELLDICNEAVKLCAKEVSIKYCHVP